MSIFSKYNIDITGLKGKVQYYYRRGMVFVCSHSKNSINYCKNLYNQYSQTGLPETITPNHWDVIFQQFSQDIHEIREIFFNKTIDTIESCCSDHVNIVNRELGGKAEIVIIAYQIIHVQNHLARYIEESELEEFKEHLVEYITGSNYRKCMDFIEGYKKLGTTMSEKKAYFFSIDVAKYILGFSNDSIPSSFPCLSSYISNGLSKDVSERLSVTECALLIASFVPKLTGATVMALAFSFNDQEYAEEIENQIETLI